GREAGAKKRRRINRMKLIRDRHKATCLGDHYFGITAIGVVPLASHLQGALIYPRSDDKALCETFYLFGLPRAEQGSAASVGAPTRPKQNAARSEETLVGSIDN